MLVTWRFKENVGIDLVWVALFLRRDTGTVCHLEKLAPEIATTVVAQNLVKPDHLRAQCPWTQVLNVDPLGCDTEERGAAVFLRPEVVVDGGLPRCCMNVAADTLNILHKLVFDVRPYDRARREVLFRRLWTHDNEAVSERGVIRDEERLDSRDEGHRGRERRASSVPRVNRER